MKIPRTYNNSNPCCAQRIGELYFSNLLCLNDGGSIDGGKREDPAHGSMDHNDIKISGHSQCKKFKC